LTSKQELTDDWEVKTLYFRGRATAVPIWEAKVPNWEGSELGRGGYNYVFTVLNVFLPQEIKD